RSRRVRFAPACLQRDIILKSCSWPTQLNTRSVRRTHCSEGEDLGHCSEPQLLSRQSAGTLSPVDVRDLALESSVAIQRRCFCSAQRPARSVTSPDSESSSLTCSPPAAPQPT